MVTSCDTQLKEINFIFFNPSSGAGTILHTGSLKKKDTAFRDATNLGKGDRAELRN